MLILAGISFSLSAVLLLAAICFLSLYIIFEHRENMLGITIGTCKKIKRKKNVLIYGKRGGGPLRVLAKIKDWRRGTYEYTVGKKVHRVRLFSYDDPRGIPHAAEIVYLKMLPGISYVKTETNFCLFEVYALAAFALAVCFAICGFSCVF